MNLDERLVKEDQALMSDKDNLNHYFNDNTKNSLYVAKNLRRKKLWKAKAYRNTGRVPIAETFNDLFRI
jgi:hypothetical protein